jgi:hypothetical protein
MNLDELISKYLDGELNEVEDTLLRSQLSEDAVARLKFDSAVNIHLAYKEDAESIYPPQELVDKTEDMIMMRIFAQAPEPQKRRMLLWNNVPMLAAVIVFFLFTFVFEISIPPVNISNNISSNELLQENNSVTADNSSDNSNIIKNANIQTKKAVKNIKPERTNQIFALVTDDNLAINNEIQSSSTENENLIITNVTNGIDAGDDNPVNSPGEPLQSKMAIMAFNNDNVNQSDIKLIADNDLSVEQDVINQNSLSSKDLNLPIANLNSPSGTNFISNNSINIIDLPIYNEFNKNVGVQVGSLVGTDLMRNGIDAKEAMISHVSQSVAYAFNESERFGVELGYTEYSYDEEAFISVKTDFGTIQSSGVESFEGGFDFSVNRRTSITITNSKKILWASAFYEYSFLQNEDFSLVGRIGAGGSNDGLLGYGRVFMQYDLFDLIQFTFGIDSRVFTAETSKFSLKGNNVKSSASLVYGLQFKF